MQVHKQHLNILIYFYNCKRKLILISNVKKILEKSMVV